MAEGRKKILPAKIDEIISFGGVFVWDTSSLCHPEVKRLVQSLFSVMQQHSTKFLVPTFVEQAIRKNQAQVSAQMILDQKICYVIPETNQYEEVFLYLRKNKKTKIYLIVNQVQVQKEAILSARKCGLLLNCVGIDENAELEVLPEPVLSSQQATPIAKPVTPVQKPIAKPATPVQKPIAKPATPVQKPIAKPAQASEQNPKPPIIRINLTNTKKEQPPVQKPVQPQKPQQPQQPQSKGYQPKFTLASVPERIALAPIKVSREMVVGDVVTDAAGTRYTLKKQESVNNGAVTFSTDNSTRWVKIFDRTALNTFTQAKIERMLSKEVKIEGLCWPISAVKDQNGIFRGYLLQAFQGIPLHLCVFKRAGIDSYFPGWTKLDLCELAETILKKAELMHKDNILFGCINPAAIRVVSKKEVYFTDTDNFQIDGFPTLTHNLSFTAPELLDRKLYFATKENEYFAIAELVFMLMMPGKTPYAVGSDERPEELIRKMRFPYCPDEQVRGSHAMPSMWRFMWSHLGSMRGAFYNVFQKDAKYNQPANRRDVIYWETTLGYYKKSLQNPEDPESLKIYPQSFVRGKGATFYRCKSCGVEHPRFYFNDTYFADYQICNSCIDKRSDVSFTCKVCDRTYYYTNRTALFHKMKKKQDAEWRDQKYCSDCKSKTLPCPSCGKIVAYFRVRDGRCPDCRQEYEQAVYRTVRCADCGSPFHLTYKDRDYFRKKGLQEPTRCPSCRERRKNQKNNSWWSF